jgi:hypothetical protein
MNDGGPIFPTVPDSKATWQITNPGMSLRDLFALAYALKSGAQPDWAYDFADKMIAARDAASHQSTEEK